MADKNLRKAIITDSICLGIWAFLAVLKFYQKSPLAWMYAVCAAVFLVSVIVRICRYRKEKDGK